MPFDQLMQANLHRRQPQCAEFPKLLEWLGKLKPGILSPSLDLKRLALVGHSRGGRLASLLRAKAPGGLGDPIKAVYLLDAVDDVGPSAVEQLSKLKPRAKLGITGVGFTTGFNPREHNFWVRPTTCQPWHLVTAFGSICETVAPSQNRGPWRWSCCGRTQPNEFGR